MFAGYVIKPLWDTLLLSDTVIETLYNIGEKRNYVKIYIWHGSKDTHFPYKRAFERYD